MITVIFNYTRDIIFTGGKIFLVLGLFSIETFYGMSNIDMIAHLWGKGNRFMFSNSKCREAKEEK